MRVGVTGANGLLGTTLVPLWRKAGADLVAWSVDDWDIRDAEATRRAIVAVKPDVVVHAAAYTAVDSAEAEPDVAMAVNRDGTANVCSACAEVRAVLVYLSTDYIYDGTARSPIPPESEPSPLGAYARSKVEGERVTRGSTVPWLVVRTGWMFGPGRRNFVSTMREAAEQRREVRVVSDLVGAPTSARLVAEALWRMVARGERDVWHLTSRGRGSWFDVAREVFDAAGASASLVKACSAADSGRSAPRPAYSVLDSSRSERALGVVFPEWRDQVRAFVVSGRLPGLGLLPEAA